MPRADVGTAEIRRQHTRSEEAGVRVSPESVGHGSVVAGRYRLTVLLSEHEGARFWRAEDRVLSRDVAVHLVPHDDPRAAPALEAARLAAVVHDPRLLRVLDADLTEQDGDPFAYVVHEWGSGRSVDMLLIDGPLSPHRAAWLVKEVAECLAACHVQGIAHGRLLPENVLINDAGGVKLIGFVVDSSLHPGPITWPVTGQELQEHEADIVNLASLLYASLTGRWPGTPGTDVPLAPDEGGRVLRPRQVRAGVPRPLDRICADVLSGPDGSTLKAHEIASRLADFVGDPTPSEPTLLRDPAEREAYAWNPDRSRSDEEVDAAVSAGVDVDTAVGAPVFFDDDTAVGWTEGVGAPDRREHADDHGGPEAAGGTGELPRDAGGSRPAPTRSTPVDGVRPLFVDDDEGRTHWTSTRRSGEDPGSGVRSLEDSQASSASGSLWPLIDSGAPDTPAHDSGRGWMRLAITLAVVVVLVIAVLLAFDLGQRSSFSRLAPGSDESSASAGGDASAAGGDSGDSNDSGPRLWPVRRAIDFDPEGDGSENPEVVADAIDPDPATAWRTLEYRGNPELGGLKSGVGLVLDLGTQREVSAVQVLLRGGPTSLQVLAAPGQGSIPSSRAGFTLVGRSNAPAGRSTIPVADGTRSRYVALWFTRLPQIASGDYQAKVAGVAVER